jgi:flagellar protein FliS
MSATSIYSKMQESAIYTMPPESLTLMLYDGALKFCNLGIRQLEEKNYPGVNESIQRVQDIIREFQITLNQDFEVSQYFGAMYDYMYRRLVEANVQKDAEILCEVRDFLREFRDLWKEAMALAKQQR